MSLERIADNESGMTYTLEAIIGVLLIIGTILYLTGNMPFTAQKTGEHSKVQLMNIGRDSLDLIVITPAYETNPEGLKGVVNRTYLLKADKEFVMPDELVNFTVYYLNETLVKEELQLYQTISGFYISTFMKNITGSTNYSWNISSNLNEYSIQARGPSGFSNSVTIKVGYYFLETDTNGIYIDATDTNVSGVVYNSSGGSSNLTMQIFTKTYGPANLSAGKTGNGTIIEKFDTYNNWSSTGNQSFNTTITKEGIASMSVNSTSNDFTINKSLDQKLDKFDILSFYFFSNTGNETITIELSNNSLLVASQTYGTLIPKDWAKINTRIINQNDVVIDSIKISVSDINQGDYFFDKMTVGEGKFKFQWDLGLPTAEYFINATDGIRSSNKHYIGFTDHGPSGEQLCQDSYIYETQMVRLFETDTDCNGVHVSNGPIKRQFFVNNERCENENCTISGSGPNNYSLFKLNDTTVGFTASVAGDYYICHHCDLGASSGKNVVVIHVLPLTLGGDSFDECIDKRTLNEYMKRYMPAYVNFNLYLIGPDGKRFEKCPKFERGELINGYPTAEAVTVSKLIHLNYIPTDIDNILELRMVLWYK